MAATIYRLFDGDSWTRSLPPREELKMSRKKNVSETVARLEVMSKHLTFFVHFSFLQTEFSRFFSRNLVISQVLVIYLLRKKCQWTPDVKNHVNDQPSILSKWFHPSSCFPLARKITFWGSTFNRRNVASGSRIVKNELLMFNEDNKACDIVGLGVYVISVRHRRCL